VLMWPPNAKLPRSAPAVLNGRCRTRLDMSRSSLGVVLWGLPARGRSVTFPVWWKRCISRTMMEWLYLKWSATLLWLKQPLCMSTACHLAGMVNFRRAIPNQLYMFNDLLIYTVRQKLSTTWIVSIIFFLIMNLFQIGLLFSLPVYTYLRTCETGYWSIFIYVYMAECVKCHV
jgi:hypothetical protein